MCTPLSAAHEALVRFSADIVSIGVIIISPTVEERVNANKLILKSANSHRTKGQAMAIKTAQSIEDHPINVVCQLVMGNFTSTPLKLINQKSVFLSVVAYSSLSADQLL